MLAIERHKLILDILKQKGNVTTAELSTTLSVSPATIRNDLNKLNKDGLIIKTHGGATLNSYKEQASSDILPQDSFKNRAMHHREEKEAIGNYALSLIKDNQCIFLDGSSTALILAKKLSKFKKLLIITNGIYTTLALKDLPNINVMIVGGMVTKNSGTVEGLLGADILNHLHVDLAFVSAKGFTLEEGCTDFNIYESELKKAVLEKCNKIVVLLDSSKFEYTSTSSFLPTDRIDLLLTDKNIKNEDYQKYSSNNVKVKVCY